jgi:hypothetical protein
MMWTGAYMPGNDVDWGPWREGMAVNIMALPGNDAWLALGGWMQEMTKVASKGTPGDSHGT